MPEEGRWKLTDAQRKALDEAAAITRQAFTEVRAKIAAAGVENTGSKRCFLCPCENFEFGGPAGTCMRPTCRHQMGQHDLPF